MLNVEEITTVTCGVSNNQTFYFDTKFDLQIWFNDLSEREADTSEQANVQSEAKR